VTGHIDQTRGLQAPRGSCTSSSTLVRVADEKKRTAVPRRPWDGKMHSPRARVAGGTYPKGRGTTGKQRTIHPKAWFSPHRMEHQGQEIMRGTERGERGQRKGRNDVGNESASPHAPRKEGRRGRPQSAAYEGRRQKRDPDFSRCRPYPNSDSQEDGVIPGGANGAPSHTLRWRAAHLPSGRGGRHAPSPRG